jgi:hypothetical protein
MKSKVIGELITSDASRYRPALLILENKGTNTLSDISILYFGSEAYILDLLFVKLLSQEES